MPKTVIVWQDFENLPVLFIVEGDQSKFDGVLINGCNQDEDRTEEAYEALCNELSALMFDELTGKFKHEMLPITTMYSVSTLSQATNSDFAALMSTPVICCGTIP